MISDQRADVLDAVARGILIEAAFLWMRPCSRILTAYSVDPPYGRVVELNHGFRAVEPVERAYLIGMIEAGLCRHPDALHRPFQLRWDDTVSEFRWDEPLFPSADLLL